MVSSNPSAVYCRLASLKFSASPALLTITCSFFPVAWNSSTNLRTDSNDDRSSCKNTQLHTLHLCWWFQCMFWCQLKLYPTLFDILQSLSTWKYSRAFRGTGRSQKVSGTIFSGKQQSARKNILKCRLAFSLCPWQVGTDGHLSS